ncbi:spore coat polysaccharide biosynthesis protein SpsF [Raineyella antarctica]|uniref:Spore coat polysaccharide biosynthesis protein SpsF n=1 Tax=Raineyella antarctica TaxID=1577474 RepID=A0A1G6GFF6_9ACTN|nr:aldo/keto reductase [Raineyella antarctica]SDB80629.1 spore coat polysaccharide biosynthesis protein SpsF [Raineyella antarctica]
MRTRVVIQSRLNSSRLPGKAMMTIGGMPLIELVARRATRGGHEVVVATSREEYDQRIADHLTRQGIQVLRGSLDNVLSRFIAATADMEDADRVVRLTGDNPVVDAELVDELIDAVEASAWTYGRIDLARVPEGLGVEVCTVGNLREAAAKATSAYDHEHVTPWIRRNLGELSYAPEGIDFDIVTYRCTIDSLADYVRVSQLVDRYEDSVQVSWRDLVAGIAREVEISGGAIPRISRGGLTLSRLLLGASQLGRDTGAIERRRPDAAEARAILSAAVARGITHVVAGRDDGFSESAVRVAYDPALRQRVGVITTVHALAGIPDDALGYAVEASLERSFAELGRRRADAVLFAIPDDALAGDGAAWQRLQRYQADGDVGQVGVVLTDPADVHRVKDLPGLGHLALPFSLVDRRAEQVADELTALAEAGVVITVHGVFAQGVLTTRTPLAEGAPAEAAALRAAVEGAAAALGRTDPVELCLAYAAAQPWVTSVVAGVENAEELVLAMGYGDGRPLSSWEVERVHQLVPAGGEDFLRWLARA